MAIDRENHKEKGNFTQISNDVIYDTRVSEKARMYLIIMLSRPDTWKFNMNWLLSVIKGGKSALQSGLDELTEVGYLKKEKRHINGRWDWEYFITENPANDHDTKQQSNSNEEKPQNDKPKEEKPSAKNKRQKNNKQKNGALNFKEQKNKSYSNTVSSNTDFNNTVFRESEKSKRTQAPAFSKPKRKFGSYQNVPLTDEEYQNLCDYYGTEETDRSIESMSKYMAVNDKKYANTAVKLEQWIEEDIEKYGYVEPDKIPTQEEVKKMFESVNKIMIARGWKTESTDTSASFPVPFPEPSGQLMAVRA